MKSHLWDKIPLGLSKGSSPDPSKSPDWEGLHHEWDGAVQRSSRCFQSTAPLLRDKGLGEFPGASRCVSLVPWKQTLLEQAPAAGSLLHFTAAPPKQPCAVGVVSLWGNLSLATALSAYCKACCCSQSFPVTYGCLGASPGVWKSCHQAISYIHTSLHQISCSFHQ